MRWTVVHGGGRSPARRSTIPRLGKGRRRRCSSTTGSGRAGRSGTAGPRRSPAASGWSASISADTGRARFPPQFEWSLDSTVDDLGAVADAAGADRFHLVGESLGGTVALAFAARRPERVLSLTVSERDASRRGHREPRPVGAPHPRGRDGRLSAHMMKERFFDGVLTPRMARWYEEQQASAEPSAILDGAAMLAGPTSPPSSPSILPGPPPAPRLESVHPGRDDGGAPARPPRRPPPGVRARAPRPAVLHAAECAAAVSRFLDGAAPGPA